MHVWKNGGFYDLSAVVNSPNTCFGLPSVTPPPHTHTHTTTTTTTYAAGGANLDHHTPKCTTVIKEAPYKYGVCTCVVYFTKYAHPCIQWDDVLPFVRERHVTSFGKVVAFPMDVNINLLFYRTDVFDRFNLAGPPRTWDEMLEVAERLHGQDMDGDGAGDWGVCMELRKGGSRF